MHFFSNEPFKQSIYIIVALKSFQLVPSVVSRALVERAFGRVSNARAYTRGLFDFFCVGGLSCSVKLGNAVYNGLESISRQKIELIKVSHSQSSQFSVPRCS